LAGAKEANWVSKRWIFMYFLNLTDSWYTFTVIRHQATSAFDTLSRNGLVKLLIRQYDDNTEQPIFDRKIRGGQTQEQMFAADHMQRGKKKKKNRERERKKERKEKERRRRICLGCICEQKKKLILRLLIQTDTLWPCL
jgi:hypothetical protein